MALDLSNSAIDRVRLRLGDTTCPYILDDQTIDYYITKNANNENQAYKELLTVMLFALSRLTRERVGDIEVYGSEYFRQYYDAVKLALSNPEVEAGYWENDSCHSYVKPAVISFGAFIPPMILMKQC